MVAGNGGLQIVIKREALLSLPYSKGNKISFAEIGIEGKAKDDAFREQVLRPFVERFFLKQSKCNHAEACKQVARVLKFSPVCCCEECAGFGSGISKKDAELIQKKIGLVGGMKNAERVVEILSHLDHPLSWDIEKIPKGNGAKVEFAAVSAKGNNGGKDPAKNPAALQKLFWRLDFTDGRDSEYFECIRKFEYLEDVDSDAVPLRAQNLADRYNARVKVLIEKWTCGKDDGKRIERVESIFVDEIEPASRAREGPPFSNGEKPAVIGGPVDKNEAEPGDKAESENPGQTAEGGEAEVKKSFILKIGKRPDTPFAEEKIADARKFAAKTQISHPNEEVVLEWIKSGNVLETVDFRGELAVLKNQDPAVKTKKRSGRRFSHFSLIAGGKEVDQGKDSIRVWACKAIKYEKENKTRIKLRRKGSVVPRHLLVCNYIKSVRQDPQCREKFSNNRLPHWDVVPEDENIAPQVFLMTAKYNIRETAQNWSNKIACPISLYRVNPAQSKYELEFVVNPEAGKAMESEERNSAISGSVKENNEIEPSDSPDSRETEASIPEAEEEAVKSGLLNPTKDSMFPGVRRETEKIGKLIEGILAGKNDNGGEHEPRQWQQLKIGQTVIQLGFTGSQEASDLAALFNRISVVEQAEQITREIPRHALEDLANALLKHVFGQANHPLLNLIKEE